eukprot:2237124-Pleurochrysis_carterae.AAC.1
MPHSACEPLARDRRCAVCRDCPPGEGLTAPRRRRRAVACSSCGGAAKRAHRGVFLSSPSAPPLPHGEAARLCTSCKRRWDAKEFCPVCMQARRASRTERSSLLEACMFRHFLPTAFTVSSFAAKSIRATPTETSMLASNADAY